MATQHFDARVLANYGIMQPVGINYGIRGGSENAQDTVVASTLALDELEVRIRLHEVACLNSGIKLPADKPASVKFRNRYIRMMTGSENERGPMSDQALDQSDCELNPGQFMMLLDDMATQQNDSLEIDSTVLARYGIVQPAFTADSQPESERGIRGGFADSVDRSCIISLSVPFSELDDEEQFGHLAIACSQVGVEQPLSDDDSIEFTAVYFEMISRRRREIALTKLNALFSDK